MTISARTIVTNFMASIIVVILVGYVPATALVAAVDSQLLRAVVATAHARIDRCLRFHLGVLLFSADMAVESWKLWSRPEVWRKVSHGSEAGADPGTSAKILAFLLKGSQSTPRHSPKLLYTAL